jgi:sugar/nucleoside kinase (ribokinase family)
MQKKYDVYGIGNALVDMEIEVSKDFIMKNKIEKGVMTLVDEARQKSLLTSLTQPPHKKQCGGSAANTVIAISQFGGKSFYSCKIAKDDDGLFYLNDLQNNGVISNNQKAGLPEGTTGKCMVFITPDADRTMNTFLGITSNFSKMEIVESELLDSKYLYVEGYLVASPTGFEAAIHAIKLARKNNIKIALTFSDPNMIRYFNKEMKEFLSEPVDLLFCNEEEAKEYAGTFDLARAREILKTVAKTFIITLGKNGAMIYDGQTFIDIEPYPVKAIDTNGAGDMFAGAFLYGITHGHTYASSGKLATVAASKVVSQFGPRLEKEEALKILKEIFN